MLQCCNISPTITRLHDFAGTCGYYRGLNKGEGELGCILLPQHKGQGFMTNALQLIIDFGINKMVLNRIWAITSQQNDKAIHLLERLNFIKIGDLPNVETEYELRSSNEHMK